MPKINFVKDNVSGFYVPAQYPVRQSEYGDNMQVPEGIRSDFFKLTSLIEDKYTKEYLKICAFYNKLFPSLKDYDWSRSSYNTVPFTLQDQERTDTGTGMSANYLKGVIDVVVARIGNTSFDYRLVADVPTALYTIYKDEIERVLKSIVRKNNVNRIGIESFHDAAILCFAHVFIDPWSGEIRKVTDWELGTYEAEFSEGHIKRAMIRDFAFPVSALGPYLDGFDDERVKKIGNQRQRVDLRLYIDCFRHKKYVTIGSDMGPETDYPFDEVLLATYSWDLGVRKTTAASLFDVLYPIQRAMNKLLAKKTQLLINYKGPVPVFNRDSEVVVKQLSNGAGECLFMDTGRDPAELMTVLQPTPLDPQLNAEVEALKGQMFELAGVQQMSLDLDNLRSAATVIAINQIHDAGFQSQLTSLAEFIRTIILMYIKFQSVVKTDETLHWGNIYKLCNEAYINILPVHDNDATSGVGSDPTDPDYGKMQIEKFIIEVMRGAKDYFDVDFTLDPTILRQTAALRLVQLKSIDDSPCEELDRLIELLIMLYVEDMRHGVVFLVQPIGQGTEPSSPSDVGSSPTDSGGGSSDIGSQAAIPE